MSRHRHGVLGKGRRIALYVICLGVWVSGGLWLLFHYFLAKQGEFGPTANPVEPWWLKLHGAFSFAALWLFGLLWGIHITKLWPHRRSRWSGGGLTGIFALLVVTGYLLYYVADDRARSFISALHWVIGLLSPLVFCWHLRRRTRRS